MSVDSNYTGVISGSGGLSKSGAKKLTISGSSGNVYAGDTNVLQGNLDLNKTSGYAIPGNLNLAPTSGVTFVRLSETTRLLLPPRSTSLEAPTSSWNCSATC